MPFTDILKGVTKRLVDVDDAKLAAVREALGTRTIKATVDEAFDEVLELVARRRALLVEREALSAELADPGSRRQAWG
jgi:Arc/MetJ family transcription regulator